MLFDDEIVVESELDSLFDYFENKPSIGFDSETTGFDVFTNKLLTVQLGDYEEQWVVDCLTLPVIQLKELLESKLTLYHNYLFDGKWLQSKGIVIKNSYDSFLGELVLTGGYDNKDRDTSLKGICKKYLNVDLDKEIRGEIHKVGLTSEVIRYAANDVKYLHQLKDAQEVEIVKYDLQETLRLENEAIRSFMLMSYHGLLVDSTKWLRVAEYVEDELNKISTKLDDLLIDEKDKTGNLSLNKYLNKTLSLFPDEYSEKRTLVNWKSPDQKKHILNDLGIKVDSVNDKVLQRNKKHEIVREMITFSKHSKFADTFGRSFLTFVNKQTGRIHADVWPVLQTGRISISNPPCQQIPAHGELAKRIKECFIAREGYTLIDTDVSGFEICIATQFSKEPRWIDILNRGGDIHSETAMLMFDIPMELVNNPFPERPNYSYRFIAKSCSFLAMYGGNEFTLADRIQVPKPKAKMLLDKYFASLPELKKFLDMLAEVAVKAGRIRSDQYYKRIRWFPKLDYDDFESVNSTKREAMNLPMQAQNANLIKECLINLQREIDFKGYYELVRILLQIHDALLSEAHDSVVNEWKETQERIMIDTISKHITLVPVKVTTTVGKHWNH